MADGTFPPEAVEILEAIGSWYNKVQESFGDAKPASPAINNREVLLTRRDNTLYVHLCKSPITRRVLLDPIRLAPARATLLNTGEPVSWSLSDLPTLHMDDDGITIPAEHHYLRLTNLPVNALSDTVPVIRVEFDGDPWE